MDITVERYEKRIEEELKELRNMGMEIDTEASWRFFHYFWDNPNHQITGLYLPSNLRNQTLQCLLSVGYGSQSDSSGESDEASTESSNGNNNESSNGEEYEVSNVEEWSQIFTKDGHFRIDEILPLLPQPYQMSKTHLATFLQNLNCARLALAHYNEENKDAPYELVMPLMCSIFNTYGHNYYNHVNFFAKSKRHDTPELFFAELWACYSEDEDPVLRCCILKPNLIRSYSSGDEADSVKHFPPTWIFHPEDVTCSCTVSSNCYVDSDDDPLP